MSKVTAPDHASDMGELTSFLSISIDVVESTPAKAEMQKFVVKHGLSIVDAYASYVKALTATEGMFLACFSQTPDVLSEPLSLDRLFLIKSIGDEWWYAYAVGDLDDFAIGQHARQIMERLLAFLSKEPFDVFLGDHAELDVDGLDEFNEIFRRNLGVKITFDLVRGYDFVAWRQERIQRNLAALMPAGRATYADNAFRDLIARAGGLFISQPSNGKVTLAGRSDYIGAEVDRFFRLTAESKPGCVLVGQNLAPHLALEPLRIADFTPESDWDVCAMRDRGRNGDMRTMHAKILASALVAHSLKGVPEPYSAMLCKDMHSYVRRAELYEKHAEREKEEQRMDGA